MDWSLHIKMNEKLFLRDPEATELGKKIVRQGALMIRDMGIEEFTFRKLAAHIGTTEAGIYRYFENKHRLLVYLVAWYWSWREYLVAHHIGHLSDPVAQLHKVIQIIADDLSGQPASEPATSLGTTIDNNALFQIVVAESNKTYLTKDVAAYNQAKVFKPYKDLCQRIASLILACEPAYAYPHSLASTLLEMAHLQYFFMHHLPSLTDFGINSPASESMPPAGPQTGEKPTIHGFLSSLVFSAIGK